MILSSQLFEELEVKETKIKDVYDPEKFEAVNLDFYIDDTLIGEASISGTNTDDAFLYDFGIFPWFRGNGYANQIIDWILNHYNVTNLTVKPDNIPAINLYKKHGFKIDRSFDDNGHEMYVMLKESITEDNDYTPADTKKDTCVAVAYSMLTGADYDDALKIFPNGKIETIKKELDLISPNESDQELDKFLNAHRRGRFLVCISDNKHSAGHAIPVINGIAYNTQNFNKNSTVTYYADLSNESHNQSTETSFFDELEKHKTIKDNKYINYAYQKIIDTFREKLTRDGKIKATVKISGQSRFELNVNNKKFEFEFPFNCTDEDIYHKINNIIEKSIV